MADQQQPVAKRQGSRWYDARPSGEDVAAWFRSQRIDGRLSHDDYVGGIVLIGSTEKEKVTLRRNDGGTYIREDERSVWVPYVKVDTRVAYFWDLVKAMNAEVQEERYVGVIDPVMQREIDRMDSHYYNSHLPEGTAVYPVFFGPDLRQLNKYLVATWRCAIYLRKEYVEASRQRPATPILEGIGSKQVQMWMKYPDDNAIMKAQTGAIGRALGVAGILVVGSGIATAEDMQEQQQGLAMAATTAETATLPSDGPAPAPAAVAAPSLPASPAEAPPAPGGDGGVAKTSEEVDADFRERAEVLARAFEEEDPERYAAYKHWYREDRRFGPVATLTGAALKGAVQKLERDLDASRRARQAE